MTPSCQMSRYRLASGHFAGSVEVFKRIRYFIGSEVEFKRFAFCRSIKRLFIKVLSGVEEGHLENLRFHNPDPIT